MRTSLAVAFVFAVLTTPEIAQAQGVTITPEEWGFGQVAIGDSGITTIRLQSTESTPLQIFSLNITDDPHGAFALTGTTPDPIPLFLFHDQFVDAHVSFTPPAEGSYSANLLLHSNDHLREFIDVPLTGSTVPEPSSLALIGMGGLALLCYGWRRRRKTELTA